jgi:hypothetical protein
LTNVRRRLRKLLAGTMAWIVAGGRRRGVDRVEEVRHGLWLRRACNG